MHARLGAALFVLVTLGARVAGAAVDAVAPAGGGLGALAVHVDLAGGRVVYQSCPGAPCAVSAASPAVDLKIDHAALPAPADVAIEVVPLALGKSVVHVHVRVPLRDAGEALSPAWEGLFAAGADPIFVGFTGWTRGEPGERTGTALRVLDDGEAKTVLVGDIQEDLRICGDAATLLHPRGLDPRTLEFRGATYQRLSSERRAAATPIVAAPTAAAEPPLAPLLEVEGASSSALGSPKTLTDGDPQSTWSEARPGQGQGEFVLMQAPHEVPIVRFAVAIAPSAPKAEGAAPKTFYLATDKETYAVTVPEDAWLHPGAVFDVPLPDPVKTSCVALILDEAYARGRAHPEVTVAELYAYSEWDAPGAKLESVASSLKGGGGRAEAAAGVLKRAGDRGLAVAASAYDALDAAGRALAVDVAASAESCTASAPILTRALVDPDEVVREKARAKLEQPHCGHEAVPTLIAALGASDTRPRAAALLASIAPSQALAPIAGVLGQGSAHDRGVLRSAFAHAATGAPPAEIARLLGGEREPAARIELLRAATDRIDAVQPAADAALSQLLSGDPDLRTRYLLIAPVAALARAGDANDEARLVGFLAHDKDAPVRAGAAELAGASSKTQAALAQAALDPDPRVRDAALRSIASSRVVSAEAPAVGALEKDPWTFVRASAAAALAALPPLESSDRALGKGVDDAAPAVRAAAIAALAMHKAVTFAPPVFARLSAAHEDLDVRVAAAHALGSLCYARAADKLAEYAVRGASSPDPDEVALGLAATDALAALHPRDLEKKLETIRGKGSRPDAKRAAEAAIAGRGGCG